MTISRERWLRLYCHSCGRMQDMRVTAARGLGEGALEVRAVCPVCGGCDRYAVGERSWRQATERPRGEVGAQEAD